MRFFSKFEIVWSSLRSLGYKGKCYICHALWMCKYIIIFMLGVNISEFGVGGEEEGEGEEGDGD